MKRLTGLVLVLLLLSGCAAPEAMDGAMALRIRLQSTGCRFRATVSADYGDKIHTFVLDCEADTGGDVSFSVAVPDTISGIRGKLTGESGFLTFDQEVLAFSMLADGLLSPVSAPWILIHTLRSGYLRSCAETDGGWHMTVNDSYAENAMQVDIWLDEETIPTGAEILWQGRRILTLKVENFEFV